MININDILHSTAVDEQNPANHHVVADASEIYDATEGKKQNSVNGELRAKDASQDETIGSIDERLTTVEGLAAISIDGGQVDIATGEDFGYDDSTHRAKMPTVGAIQDFTDDVPTVESGKFVKSGGVSRKVELCNIPEVNAFVADIVLKDGVDDPNSDDYVNFAGVTQVLCESCFFKSSTDKYENSVQVYVNDAWKVLFYKAYDTLAEAQADLGKLIEGKRCYVVLKDSGVSGVVDAALEFYRDVTWKSLNEHPIIKGLMMEQDVEEIRETADDSYDDINGYTNKGIKQELTVGTFWHKDTHERTSNASFVSNDVTACQAGDTFIITGTGGNDNSRLYVFADANGDTIQGSSASGGEAREDYTLVAPAGAASFYFSANVNYPYSLRKNGSYQGILADIAEIRKDVKVSKMSNMPVNLKKPNLKVLDLGNSYSGDATHYLAELLTAAGITTGFSLYSCTRGGSSFRSWVNLYEETDTGATYTLSKVAGDTIDGISGGTGTDNTWFVNLLKKDWDIILIHQMSQAATDYDSWTKNNALGGLTEYLRILKTYCPQATIGSYIIHSYPSWQSSPYQIGADSTERWQNIAKAVEHLKADYGIDFIIPYGTAIQNLRMTSINPTDPVDSTKKNDFSADGTHMTSGIGDYVAACAYFEALFAPRYDVTVLGNSYTNTSIPVPQEGDADYYQGRGVPVQISAANALLAQKAAILAVNDMFHLNNPETSGFVPDNTDTRSTYSGTGDPSGLLDGIYDVTANNNGATFASLRALLSDEHLSDLIPDTVRKGGMSIKFVLSSDNKYIQARCMAQNFTTDVTQWQGVDEDLIDYRSNNLAKSGVVVEALIGIESQVSENQYFTPQTHFDDSESDLSICDENNNVLVGFLDGHIKTKHFDSKHLCTIEGNTLIIN